MERKIGEEFEYNGVRLKVVEADECDKCYFAYKRKYGACTRSKYISISGFCSEANREDRKSVQFIEIKNEKMKEETKSLPIPEGWEFAGYENGEVKIRRAEPELPTTYEEAVDVINYDILTRMLVPQNMSRPVTALCNLLVCRNAWWQKLGWRPDFGDGSAEKYCIIGNDGKISKVIIWTRSELLVFPTEEVRDKFAETFKDLIEEAKELL